MGLILALKHTHTLEKNSLFLLVIFLPETSPVLDGFFMQEEI